MAQKNGLNVLLTLFEDGKKYAYQERGLIYNRRFLRLKIACALFVYDNENSSDPPRYVYRNAERVTSYETPN